MVTVEKIFHKKVDEVTIEEINWYFDNCVGYPSFEKDWAKALPNLPKGWEELLWQRYTPEDVVEKYKSDYYYCMMLYEESVKEPDNPTHLELFNGYKSIFYESWRSSMVLKWVEEGRFSKEEGHKLKKMYFDLAMF